MFEYKKKDANTSLVKDAIGKSLAELRLEDKKDKQKKKKKENVLASKSKPFTNPNNKIMLANREDVINNIRQGNRTAILLNREFDI